MEKIKPTDINLHMARMLYGDLYYLKEHYFVGSNLSYSIIRHDIEILMEDLRYILAQNKQI